MAIVSKKKPIDNRYNYEELYMIQTGRFAKLKQHEQAATYVACQNCRNTIHGTIVRLEKCEKCPVRECWQLIIDGCY